VNYKKAFDYTVALIVLLLSGGILILGLILASIDTKSFGLFKQQRIGRYGKPFTIFKIKTINDKTKSSSWLGKVLRATKLDELPQLCNILNGTMSFVGPRPDIAGYADQLQGEDRIILQVRPGITGLASIKYRNEEELLKNQPHPAHYNDTIIWPDKVRINKWYVQNQSFAIDIKILFFTLLPSLLDIENFMTQNTKIK